MIVKSRILQFINKDLMIELNTIARDVLISDNNKKMDLFLKAFEKHGVDVQELGPGTNRGAFLIDGYVFKIGFDKAGIADNWSEFSLSHELQPFVTKCYECNGLIAVAEYVTVISKDEFQNNKEGVRQILSHLSDSYLLGDVGSVNKNFTNWGYRDDGSLVILDYAYIYRVIGDELLCNGAIKDKAERCEGILEYDINFHGLICPKCRRKYTFHEVRRKISKEYEEKEKNAIKNVAYKMTKPSMKVKNNTTIFDEKEPEINNEGAEYTMSKKHYNYEENIGNEELYDLFVGAIDFMKNMINNHSVQKDSDDSEVNNSNDEIELSDSEDTNEEDNESVEYSQNIDTDYDEDDDEDDKENLDIESLLLGEQTIDNSDEENDDFEIKLEFPENQKYVNEDEDDDDDDDIDEEENDKTTICIAETEEVKLDTEGDIENDVETKTVSVIQVDPIGENKEDVNEESENTSTITLCSNSYESDVDDEIERMRQLLSGSKASLYDEDTSTIQKIRKVKQEFK